ncbi:unnamed protein product [Colias eurytheme]|nr:unnamed protein product [Colias eurytheme]
MYVKRVRGASAASNLILIAGDILINTPPARPLHSPPKRNRNVSSRARNATEKRAGRRRGAGGQSRASRAAERPMARGRRGGRAHAAAPSFRSDFLFIVARNTARDGCVMRV